MTITGKIAKIIEKMKRKRLLQVNEYMPKLYVIEYVIKIYLTIYGEKCVYSEYGEFSKHFLGKYKEAFSSNEQIQVFRKKNE